MDENIRNSVLKFSVSFWLDIDLKSLQQRLSNFEKRPLLSNDNLEKTLDLILSAFPFLCFIPAQCECPAMTI